MENQFLEIDGSLLEGGGQILRNALSLSCITGTPIHIYNIRAGRPKPGLAAQHLKGVELVKEICSAQVEGAVMGSKDLKFKPSRIKGGRYFSNIGTAGSIALLIQVSLPVLLFADVESMLDLKGGTNAAMAPQIDYLTEIFRPNLEKLRATFDLDLMKRGYFPKGGGLCKIKIKPIETLQPIELTNFGQVHKLFGWSFVAGTLSINISDLMVEEATKILSKYAASHRDIKIESYKEDPKMADSNCSGIIIGCETTTGCIVGGSGLGNRQENPIDTGRRAAGEVEKCITEGSCVDDFCQDQLIIFMALAGGVSRIKASAITLHTKTSIYIAELLTKARFNIIDNNDGTRIIECRGIGFRNQFIE